MTDALVGIACGILAAAAAFGIWGQISASRVALQRGAQAASLLGTVIILVALLTHGLAAASPQYFLDSAGRALSIAIIGLIVAWLPIVRSRSRPRDNASLSIADTESAGKTSSGQWWTFGLAAALAGWAEFIPADETLVPLSTLLIGLLLLVAGGLAIPACGLAAATLLRPGVHPTADKEFSKLAAAAALVLLAMLILSAQTFFANGIFWPQTAGFKAMAGAWLILLSACLMKDRRAGLWLSILSALVLVIVLLLPGIWVARSP